MSTQFPMRARRGDTENGYMIVQQMVEWLRDAFDTFAGKFAKGSATVPNGNTAVIVSLGTTLASYQIVVTPTVDPVGRFWVSNKTSTQFQINLSAAAPVSGVAFDWIARA